MKFRTAIHGVTVAFAVLLGVVAGAPVALAACDGADCPSVSKPLDLQKFMREQAASTRTPEAMRATAGKSRHVQAPKTQAPKIAQSHHRSHHAAATQARAEQKPSERASAEAAAADTPATDIRSSAPDVQVVSADEVNSIDLTAGPAPVQTGSKASDAVQGALTAAQDVQVVVGDNFNKIDKAAALTKPVAATETTGSDVAAAPSDSEHKSWMAWLWSAIGAGFVVLAGVARYLFA